MSTRVRATAVTGMPRTCVVSMGARRARVVRSPSTSRSFGAVTSGLGRAALDQAEQVRRREAAQHRADAARADRCKVGRLDARGAVAYAVDAAVLSNQRANTNAVVDLPLLTPASRSSARLTTPCARPASRARIPSTVRTFPDHWWGKSGRYADSPPHAPKETRRWGESEFQREGYCNQPSTVSRFASTQSCPALSGSTLSPAIALATLSWSSFVSCIFFSTS